MKLVQLSTLDFEKTIQQELEENPALDLEESSYEECTDILENDILNIDNPSINSTRKNEYINNNQIENFTGNKNNNKKNLSTDYVYNAITYKTSFQDYLKNQLHTFRFLNQDDLLIADFILGNIDGNGYIRRKIKSIADDIFLILGISVTKEKLEQLIEKYIHKLEPIGVGSRDLKECLLIQLSKKKINQEICLAKKIIQNYFELFIRKHYRKLIQKLKIKKNKLRKAIFQIKKLNPKPGKIFSDGFKNSDQFIPDFTIHIVDEKLELSLHYKNNPELKISPIYFNMLKYYKSSKKIQEKQNTISFIKKKIDSARWIVDAIKQRTNTLILTMKAIMEYQKEYFLTGDLSQIKPMILKNISHKIGIGISTVSRVANSKYVSTPYGTFLIKSFFSEKMKNKEGEEISSIEIKKILWESISNENKKTPFTDEKLSELLKKKGYLIARRTIAKYRDQMKIPVARMRKIL